MITTRCYDILNSVLSETKVCSLVSSFKRYYMIFEGKIFEGYELHYLAKAARVKAEII